MNTCRIVDKAHKRAEVVDESEKGEVPVDGPYNMENVGHQGLGRFLVLSFNHDKQKEIIFSLLINIITNYRNNLFKTR